MHHNEKTNVLNDLSWYLDGVAKVIDASADIRNNFDAAGLILINRTWSSYPEEAKQFALEKSKYGNAAQTLGDKRFGYDSPWFHQVLLENGLTNADLFDYERSAECEARINSDPRLAPYHRAALVPLSAAEGELQVRERRAESGAIGTERMLRELGLPVEISVSSITFKQAVSCFARAFEAFGLKPFKPEVKRYVAGFANPTVTGAAAFYLQLDSLEFNYAFVCDIKLGMRHDVAITIDGVPITVKWDLLTRSLTPMIEGFGRYAVSMTKDEFLISLYATVKIIPFIIKPFLLK